MYVLIPIIYSLISFIILFFCFDKIKSKTFIFVATDTEDSDYSAPQNNSILLRIRDCILYKKNSALITSLILAALGGMCGFFAVYYLLSFTNLVRLLLGYCLLAVCALTDIDNYTIYNRVLILFAGLRLILFPVEYFMLSSKFFPMFIECIISAAGCFVVLMLISFISRGGIGMGDVKLFASLAFITGFYSTLNTLLYGLILCALISIVLLFFTSKKAKDKVPFAPFIYLGFIISIILGAF
jgi:Flp pilus assembly protein protease CpaA